MAYIGLQRVEISTPFSSDVIFRELVCRESFNEAFEIEVTMVSQSPTLKFDDVLGAKMHLELTGDGDSLRHFSGHVGRFSQVQSLNERDDGGTVLYGYRATLVPWLWLLTQRSTCRVFQEKTAVEIIKAVFQDAGFSDYRQSLSGSYRPREYCVQYNETDFDFVMRLMEEEGIACYFLHEKNKHTLMMVDSNSAFTECPNCADMEYHDGLEAGGRSGLHDWHVRQELRTAAFAHTDYDFTAPTKDLLSVAKVQRRHDHGSMERFEYPGRYEEVGDGDALSKVRIGAIQATQELIHAESTYAGVLPGHTFRLTEHRRSDQNRQYLILSAVTTVREPRPESLRGKAKAPGERAEDRPTYECRFTAVDTAREYRPPRRIPMPVIRGPQTADVVGKSGEEIWTDKYGRIKVKFRWDRDSKKDETSSCWMRVVQPWAGKQWGQVFLPRVGHEVIVEFLGGDPDRPIVTGSVYNADNMPPYALPDNQTQSGVKSRSSKSGTAENFNELRFEDKKDAEEIYVHAERDFTRIVENDDVLKVGFEKKDSGDQTIDIHNNRTVTLAEGDDALTIKKGDRTTTLDKGSDTIEVKSGERTVKVSKKILHDSADHDIKASGKILLQANSEIKLKVGSGEIVIDAGGNITLKGIQIKMEGTAGIDAKSNGTANFEGLTTTVKGMQLTVDGKQTTVKGIQVSVAGDAMASVRGGVTMLG